MNNAPPAALHQLFEQQAALLPNHIALECDAEQISYAKLNHLANQFAAQLILKGIGKGCYVGLLLNKSVHAYIAMLAVLKTGAAYVGLDPEYPADRIQYILTDCKINLLITHSHLAVQLPTFGCQYFLIDQEPDNLSNKNFNNPEYQVAADDACYVIYTSGSTGTPKGVAISHAAVCNYIHAAQQVYAVTSNDRIYQGFSISFDASVEEIWLALSSGATLVPGMNKALHAGAGLVEFLTQRQITLLSCVPTLLAMLDPPVPSLRLLILGGEVCPPDLIMRWHQPGLRILNTYGPTEATVVTTYAECLPGQPITIGKPLPTYEVFILDAELKLAQPGEEGELCIGGVSLAQGYVNRPDLTANKFIYSQALENKRLYRTGDLGRWLENGEIQFTGRSDGQIKLRGFRIELAEIETVLLTYPQVKAAAVTVMELTPGVQSLIAYLVAEKNVELNIEKIPAFLHHSLPEYMTPGIFELLAELPTLPSGKVDRKRLPKPKMHHDNVNFDYVAPRTDVEKKIVAVWEEFFQHSPISITADFFHDLGGHSLLAAKTVSLLRKDAEFAHLSILDIYQNTTIKKLAQKLTEQASYNHSELNNKSNTESEQAQKSTLQYYFCGLWQLITSYIPFGIQAWQLMVIVFVVTYVTDKYSLFSAEFLLALAGLIIALPVSILALAITAKWLLLGKIKPGEYPLWGWYYMRWWLCRKIEALAPVKYLTASPLLNLYYRLMGAKIGKDCYIATEFVHSYDLLSIGDYSSIGYETRVFGFTIEKGLLKIGMTKIGDRCNIGTRVVISHNTIINNDAVLADLAMLPAEKEIPPLQSYHGSPAIPMNSAPAISKNIIKNSAWKNSYYGLLHALGLVVITMIYYVTYIPAILLVEHFYDQNNLLGGLLIGAPVGAIIFILFFCASIIITKKLILNRLQPGAMRLRSFIYLRFWIVSKLLDNRDLEVLGDSLYYPVFLRLLGAKIGRRVEMGEMTHSVPDVLELEDESFIASWVLVGLPQVFGGIAYSQPVHLGKRAFVGNDSLLPPGTKLGDGILLGCLTVPPVDNAAEKAGTSWLGTPAMYLPRRDVFTGFSERETSKPGLALYLKRLAIEFVRIAAPSAFSFISLIWMFMALDYLYGNFSLIKTILLFPIFDFFIQVTMSLGAILLKWILMGEIKEGIKPVWSVYVWKYDIVVRMYENFIDSSVIEPFLGTPFAAIFLRLLGAKIGKRVLINTKFFFEFDLVEIGDDVILNTGAAIQTHLYEDRVYKTGRIKIGDGCNVGCDAIVLYNTVMEPGASLGNLSLLMKGEHLPAASCWEGVPAQAIRYAHRDSVSVVSGEAVPAPVY